MTTYATAFGPEPFTPEMGRAVGLTRGALRVLVRGGQVRRALHGVYVDGLVPDDVGLRARALSLIVPSDVVVCLRTAAWLWGVEILAMGAHLALPPVDVMGPERSAATRRRGVAGHTGRLADGDVLLLSGVPVTTPLRTAVDVARLLSRPDALASLDALLRLPGLERAAILDELELFGRHRGVVQGRELVAFADARAESAMESRTRLRAHDAGFPPFEPQVEVFDDLGLFVARLDLGRRDERKAVEYDGDVAHATAAQQAQDRRRRRAVEEQCGWAVAVVTGLQVLSRGLAFERGVAELLGTGYRIGRHHPRVGGWEPAPWTAGAGPVTTICA